MKWEFGAGFRLFLGVKWENKVEKVACGWRSGVEYLAGYACFHKGNANLRPGGVPFFGSGFRRYLWAKVLGICIKYWFSVTCNYLGCTPSL